MESLVEVVVSEDRKYKAEIHRRTDGVLEIFLFHEIAGDSEWEPERYWSPMSGRLILTDTIERARALAEEELRLTGTA